MKHPYWRIFIWVGTWLVAASFAASSQETTPASNTDEPGVTQGARPYELDWANRTEPAHPQLVDFENLEGWHTRCENAKVQLFRSAQEFAFGSYAGKVVYTGQNNTSRFILEPPQPLPIPNTFTAVDLWVRGNNWGWINPPATPRVTLAILIRDAKGQDYRISLGSVDFDYWSLMHAVCIAPDGNTRLYESLGADNDGIIDFPAQFIGLEVSGCSSETPARLYFDALSFYEATYPPLELAPIPSDLPWPTTPNTLLPTVAKKEDIAFVYTPETGTLGDLKVSAGGQEFYPCWSGGITFDSNDKTMRPGDEGITTRLTGDHVEGDTHVYEWELTGNGMAFQYSYGITIKNKSCIVDITSNGNNAEYFDIGLAKGLQKPKTIFFPYLTYGHDWPKVVCSDGSQGPLFLLALLDYYHSDASELYGTPRLKEDAAIAYAGGCRYRPTTAGKRNTLHERLFVNVSSDVHEVLPNIPNPDSDTLETARSYLWRNIGSLFQNELLSRYKAYGIDHFIACHHEVGWREGGESFTLRDRPAPSIGEDRLIAYSAFVHSLGYRFGTYTNYVDISPVNSNWNENRVVLNSNGQWQRAWPRCYSLKPIEGAELEASYAPRIHERYNTDAQYCDVETALLPWEKTDYDARTPGAGMFRTQFNAYARLLLNESTAHHGPVFSEGNYHWFYAGIVDGNYATIVPYGAGTKQPPLVDFDLLKMHTKMTDFGMGAPCMYFGMSGDWTKDTTVTSPYFDRFITATIAFGHLGYLTEEWGFEGTLKSYYLLQALQQRYIGVPVKSIAYYDGIRYLDTSAALLKGAQERQQVRVEYDNGLTIWCNLNTTSPWQVECAGISYMLPPSGFLAYRPNDILAYSAQVKGQRHELVQCADYLYLDSRDHFVRTSTLSTSGRVAVKKENDTAWWIIPTIKTDEVTIDFSWLGAHPNATFTATAHAENGDVLGEARVLRGFDTATVFPFEKAAKYHLVMTDNPSTPPALRLTISPSPRAIPSGPSYFKITADTPARTFESTWDMPSPATTPQTTDFHTLGAQVDITTYTPANAPVYKRCWHQLTCKDTNGTIVDTRWTDVLVVPAVEIEPEPGPFSTQPGKGFLLNTATRNNASPGDMNIRVTAPSFIPEPFVTKLTFTPDNMVKNLSCPIRLSQIPQGGKIHIQTEIAGQQNEFIRYLDVHPILRTPLDLTQQPFRTTVRLRGAQTETVCNTTTTGAEAKTVTELINDQSISAIYTHPPYQNGVGYVAAIFNIHIPDEHPRLDFAIGFRPKSTTQDGCTFKVTISASGKEDVLFSENYADPSTWVPRSIDLSAYTGQMVTLKLLTDVGPNDNSTSDWGEWIHPRIVQTDPIFQAEWTATQTSPRFLPQPEQLEDMTRTDFANITSARITFEGAGIDGGQYETRVSLNNVPIGPLPACSGDETWTPATIELSPAAIATLGPLNILCIQNPNHDAMKIRAFCLHIELKDGRKGSSLIDARPCSSDETWPFKEGQAVTIGNDLPDVALYIPARND